MLPDGVFASIAVKSGRIVSVEPEAPPSALAVERLDVGGRLVVPGFIEGHIHLDKTLIGDSWKPHRPCTAGFYVRERVAFEKETLASAAPIGQRASALIELAVSRGTTHMRCHVDVDGQIELRNLEAILAVRERYRDVVGIDIVAFPQSGILASPGTAELLDQAITRGANLVGGLDPAGFDGDVEGHLNVVFGIAERRGAGIDIHLHDPGALGIFELEQIAARTKASGMQGHVAVSHAYALGDVSLDIARRTAAILAEAGISIMTNAPGARAFPPILTLREAGVVVFSGSDNIRDAWWPYGDGDMLERAMLLGYRSGFYTDAQLATAFELVTSGGAKALRLSPYGLRDDAAADFVILNARSVAEAVVVRPSGRTVYKNGRRVAHQGIFQPLQVNSQAPGLSNTLPHQG